MIVGGLFLFGSLAGSSLLKGVKQSLPPKETMMKSLGKKVGAFLGGNSKEEQPSSPKVLEHLDITYKISLTTKELKDGKVIQLQTKNGDDVEVLKIQIPPESRDGQKLRLKGRGNEDESRRGDLYLHLQRSA